MIKVVAYWNVNVNALEKAKTRKVIKVVAYWNVNVLLDHIGSLDSSIKVVAYWNVNIKVFESSKHENRGLK